MSAQFGHMPAGIQLGDGSRWVMWEDYEMLLERARQLWAELRRIDPDNALAAGDEE